MTGDYDIQCGTSEETGERGTWIVREDSTNEGPTWTRIARFIPGEYTEADEAILGNADTLARALEAIANEAGDTGRNLAWARLHARAALRAAGRLP